ncbi:MAG: hypothetical protein DI586_00145 [Micavibrio aeruginosavorus]|uniref:SD-repeat containing protein B domain-containing protein n=1 Tax=Micavibrio aeruginosavorus TaxID=349221 RepID=A0A2W5FUL4_9BACT|nr:MAG: hypothetical protein DI586_00145 [Micavibrio aeruginosavorus]
MNSGAFAQAAEGMPAPEIQLQEEGAQQLNQDSPPANVINDTETENKIELSGNDEILVAVNINGMIREEGLSIFLPAGASYSDVMVPLRSMAELLTFAITVNTGDKKAEGFFISSDNVFQLDLNSGDVLVDGKKEKLEAGEAEIIEDDIFVRASSLKKWFGISATLNINSLVLDLDTGSDLPFQERMKRLLNAEKRMKTFRYDAIKPQNAVLAPYRNFSYPSLYITTTGGIQKSSSGQSFLGLATLQGNQDIAKFEADYAIGTRYNSRGTSEISNSRLTFQRRDNQNNLLGPLRAGRISFGDVSFPSVPLFAGGQRGAGIEISSDSRLGSRYATNSENFILDGDAPVGWDAELYRNGSFIAFQQVGSDGRFVFENVNLPSGFNNFEVILYGPQGQKTSIKREIARGPRLLRDGEIQYDFAAGTPESDFLPFDEDAQSNRTPGMSGQIFYGVSKFFTLGTSVYSGPQDAINNDVGNFTSTSFESGSNFDDRDSVRASGAAVSAATSFSGINLQGQALAADSGRRAYELAAATKPFGFNLGASHTTYRNFLSEDQDIKSRNEVNLSRNFGGLNLTFRVEDRDFLNREDDRIFEQITSFKFLGISINNDLVRTFSKSKSIDDFEGELSALASLYNIRLRSALLYDLDEDAPSKYRRLSFSGQKSLSSRTSFRFEGSHDFESKTKNLNLRLSRDFDKYGLDFDVNADTENNYAFTVGLRVALQPDQKNNYHFVDPRTGGLASLGARAFIDDNNNEIYDNGEKTIEGVEFKSSTRSEKAATDKEGVSYLTGLGEAPARIIVQTESIPDIYLAPKFDHRDLIPRRGSTPVIDFPFVKMSEIAGYLTHLKRGLEGVVVRLVSGIDGKEVEKTETDSDGYFIFPAVKGGNYKIAFGLPDREFMSLNVDLDASIEDPEEMKVEATDELAKATEQAASVQTSAGSSARQRNIDALNAPAGAMPNIDDPLSEEDLKELDEKAIEGIITQ